MPGGELFQAAVLGVLQGLTEFLPVSSSAHLLVLPWLAGWRPLGLTFDVMLHAGTLLALLIYFRREWVSLAFGWTKPEEARSPRELRRALLLGTVPAGVVGFLGVDFIELHLRQPVVTASNLAIFGLLLAWADSRGQRRRRLQDVSLRDGILIGTAQALALMPGVSRSGVTVTAALLLGLSRRDAARFSFLLGTPLLALASADRMLALLRHGVGTSLHPASLVLGVLFSFASGWVCIKYFLRFLEKRTYRPFAWYRCLLAVLLFLWWLL